MRPGDLHAQRSRALQHLPGLSDAGGDPGGARPALKGEHNGQHPLSQQSRAYLSRGLLVADRERHRPLQAVGVSGAVQIPDPGPHLSQIGPAKARGVRVDQDGRRLDRPREARPGSGSNLRIVGLDRRGRLRHQVREVAGSIALKGRQVEVGGERHRCPEKHYRVAEPDQEPAEPAEETSRTHKAGVYTPGDVRRTESAGQTRIALPSGYPASKIFTGEVPSPAPPRPLPANAVPTARSYQVG